MSNTTTATRDTKASREAAHVAAYLARRGWLEVPSSSCGGVFWAKVPVPAECRNGRKSVTVLCRRGEVVS
jgi:hypothetical protein